MGNDKITQSVQVVDNAQTGNITLIGKIENVVKVIKQPALWQDAIWGFIVKNWVAVFSCVLVQGLVLLIFLRYKNLFLIPVLAYLVLGIFILVILWGVNLLFQAKISKKSLFFSFLALCGFIGVVGWVTIPIYNPEIFPTDKFGIAVATFGEGANYNLSNKAREISDQVYYGLCQEVSRNISTGKKVDPCIISNESDSLILIKKIGVIPNSKIAEWYARRIGADVVIWGQVLKSGQASTTIRFQIDETLDKAVSPEFPVVMPVTSNFTEVIIKEIDYESDPVLIKQAISSQTTYVSSFALGLFEYLQRDFPAAVNYFDIAKGIADKSAIYQKCKGVPENDDINCKSLALLYLYLGRSYNAEGAQNMGQPVLLSAREFNPREPATLISLAIGYGSQGQIEERDKYLNEALDAIELWLTNHPLDTAAALYDRGVIYQI